MAANRNRAELRILWYSESRDSGRDWPGSKFAPPLEVEAVKAAIAARQSSCICIWSFSGSRRFLVMAGDHQILHPRGRAFDFEPDPPECTLKQGETQTIQR